MKLFIDSAEISEIEAAAKTGLVDGVTTNPSLLARPAATHARIRVNSDNPATVLDVALVERGLVESRAKAQRLHAVIVAAGELEFQRRHRLSPLVAIARPAGRRFSPLRPTEPPLRRRIC